MEKVDPGEESKGLSIFGIPIPTIPISLSFGLVPALTQAFANGGLIPLGRKGEASQEKHGIGEVPPEEYDQTRGPDTQVPVWVDRLKNIDFKKVAALFPDAKSSLEQLLDSRSQSQEASLEEYGYQQPGAGEEFTYQQPNNPLIPLSGEKEDPRSSGYFPYSSQGYFPVSENAVPILKFDHPLRSHPPPGSPIFPPTNPRKRHTAASTPRRKTESFEPLFIPAGRDGNLAKESVSLRPEQDYQYTGNTLLVEGGGGRKPAFPGIEATMRNTYLPPATAKTPPSLDFEETSAAAPQYEYEYEYAVQEPPYSANIPEYLNDYDYLPKDVFAARSSTIKPSVQKPGSSTVRREQLLDQETTPFNEVVTGTEGYKVTTSFYDPRRNSQKKKEKEFVESLMKQNNRVEEVDIYEVTTKYPVTLQSIEETLGIDVAHKGTPKEELLEETSEETVLTTSKPEYEYEYEYEYVYEDELGNQYSEDAVTTTTAKTSKESLQSILNFLNKESTTLSSRAASQEESLRSAALGKLVPLALPDRHPTPLPPIRSSTFLYDQQGNYPEVQRSTVTVQIEDRFGRSRSSLSPVQGPTARSDTSQQSYSPDRLDPASSPRQGEGGDNSVNWYYSSYNNENTDPYVGPGGGAVSWGGGLVLPLALLAGWSLV